MHCNERDPSVDERRLPISTDENDAKRLIWQLQDMLDALSWKTHKGNPTNLSYHWSESFSDK